jgi:hypothetical protein
MGSRETQELRLLGHVRNPHRAPISKQDPENAMVAGEIADPSSRHFVDPTRDETLEVCPGAVEDAKRGIARVDKPRGHVCGLLKNILERGLRADSDICRRKLSKAFSISSCGQGWWLEMSHRVHVVSTK